MILLRFGMTSPLKTITPEENLSRKPTPKIDHHHLEEHEWNIGTDHSDFDSYEDLEPDHSPDIPQESGDGMRPLAHSSPNRILTNNPVTKPVTPPAQTSTDRPLSTRKGKTGRNEGC